MQNMIEQKIKARHVQEGDFLPGLNNGFVFTDPEPNDGYLSYPRGHYGGGPDVAMPGDTIIITFHDAEGEECYLLMPADSLLTVKGEERDIDDEDEED